MKMRPTVLASATVVIACTASLWAGTIHVPGGQRHADAGSAGAMMAKVGATATICDFAIMWPYDRNHPEIREDNGTKIKQAEQSVAKGNPGFVAPDRFFLYLTACRRIAVSCGDPAEVFVDFDANGTFDADELYPAQVTCVDRRLYARQITIAVTTGRDMIENHPSVMVASINSIGVTDENGETVQSTGDFAVVPDPDYTTLGTQEPTTGHHGLAVNYPNPFNAQTVISYFISSDEHVTLAVYDVLGRQVRKLVDGFASAGQYDIAWDATDAHGEPVPSGIYFYRLIAGDFNETRKMVLMK